MPHMRSGITSVAKVGFWVIVVLSAIGCSSQEAANAKAGQPVIGQGQYLLMPGHEGITAANAILDNGGLTDPNGGEYKSVTVRIPEFVSGTLVSLDTHGWVKGEEVVLWNGQTYTDFEVTGEADVLKDVAAQYTGIATYADGVQENYNAELTYAIGPIHPIAACLLNKLGHNNQGVAVSDLKTGINKLEPEKVVRYCVQNARSVHMAKAASLRVAGMLEEASVAADLAAEFVASSEEAMKSDWKQTFNNTNEEWGHPVYIAPFWQEYFAIEKERASVEIPTKQELAAMDQPKRIETLLSLLTRTRNRYAEGQLDIESLLIEQGVPALEPLIKVMEENEGWSGRVFDSEFESKGYLRFLGVSNVAAKVFNKIVELKVVEDTNGVVPHHLYRRFWDRHKAATKEDVWFNVIASPYAGQQLEREASLHVGRSGFEALDASGRPQNPYSGYTILSDDESTRSRIEDSLRRRIDTEISIAKNDQFVYNRLDSAAKFSFELLALNEAKGWPQIKKTFDRFMKIDNRTDQPHNGSSAGSSVGVLASALISREEPFTVQRYVSYIKTLQMSERPYAWADLFSPLWSFPRKKQLHDQILPLFGDKNSALYIGSQYVKGREVATTNLLLFPEFRDAVLVALEDSSRLSGLSRSMTSDDVETVADGVFNMFMFGMVVPASVTDPDEGEEWKRMRIVQVLSDDMAFIEHFLQRSGRGLRGSATFASDEVRQWLASPLDNSHVRKVTRG